MPERQVDEIILTTLGIYEGDFARAAHYRIDLVNGKALLPYRANGETFYQRSDTFPEPPSHNGYGSAAFNAELEKRAAEERRLHDEADANAQRLYEDSAAGREKRELKALIDQRAEAVFDKKLTALIKDLDRPTVERIRERLNREPGTAA